MQGSIHVIIMFKYIHYLCQPQQPKSDQQRSDSPILVMLVNL